MPETARLCSPLPSSTHTIYQLLTDSTGPNLVLSGLRNSTSMRHLGTIGYYWSSTAHSSATYAYVLYLNSSGAVSPSLYDYYRYYGFALRCLAAAQLDLLSLHPPPIYLSSFPTPTTLTIPP